MSVLGNVIVCILRSSLVFPLGDEIKKIEYEMRIATDHAESEAGNAD